MFRRADLIHILAKLDGRAEYAVSQQLKTPYLVACLEPLGQDNRIIREYGAREIVRARLLLAAREAGLRWEDISVVNDALNQRMGLGEWNDPGIANGSGLDAIINAAKNDVSAAICIEVGFVGGKRVIRVAVDLENYRDHTRAWRTLAAMDAMTVLVRSTIPASRLAAGALAEVG